MEQDKTERRKHGVKSDRLIGPACRIIPSDPALPRRAAPRRSPRQRAAHDPAPTVPRKVPDALLHRRRQPEIVEPLQNRVQKLTLRALRNRYRNRKQRRQRTRKRLRDRPIHLQPHPRRSAAPTAPPARTLHSRKPDQTFSRKLAKQRTRGNILHSAAAVPPAPALAKRNRKPRAAPVRVRRQQRTDLRQLRRADPTTLYNPVHDGQRNTTVYVSPAPGHRVQGHARSNPKTQSKSPTAHRHETRNIVQQGVKGSLTEFPGFRDIDQSDLRHAEGQQSRPWFPCCGAACAGLIPIVGAPLHRTAEGGPWASWMGRPERMICETVVAGVRKPQQGAQRKGKSFSPRRSRGGRFR